MMNQNMKPVTLNLVITIKETGRKKKGTVLYFRFIHHKHHFNLDTLW